MKRTGSARRAAEEPVRPFERVVIPVEGTDREYEAQRSAVELAAALGIPALGLHVEAGPSAPAAELFDYLRQECWKWAVDLQVQSVRGTDVVQEILEELDVRDLVVLGTHRLASDFHLGSVAGALLRRAPCPVQLVRLP